MMEILALGNNATWMERALCAEPWGNELRHNPDDWMPSTYGAQRVDPFIEYAKNICGRCPVADACFTAALDRKEKYGIYGGVRFDKNAGGGGATAKRLTQERARFKRKAQS